MMNRAEFWSKIAEKYAASPVKNQAAYESALAKYSEYLTPETTALEVGCGTGSTALTLAPKAKKILATDFSSGMIDIARRKQDAGGPANVEFDVASISKAAARGPFDVVMAFSLLHLLADLDGDLRAIAGGLAPGGIFVSKTVCLSGWLNIMRIPIGLLQLFGKAPPVYFLSAIQVETKIRAAGFEIVESYAHPKGSHNQMVIARKPG